MMQVQRSHYYSSTQTLASVASSLAPDNLKGMTTIAEGDRVTTMIHGTQIRSVIASVDDYLMNLAIADDTTTLTQKKTGI